MKNKRTSSQKPYSDAKDHSKLNLKRVADFSGKALNAEGQGAQNPVIVSAEVANTAIRKSMEKKAQPSMELPAYTKSNNQNSSTINLHRKNKSS